MITALWNMLLRVYIYKNRLVIKTFQVKCRVDIKQKGQAQYRANPFNTCKAFESLDVMTYCKNYKFIIFLNSSSEYFFSVLFVRSVIIL